MTSMANVFERIDGFVGRLVFRAIGCVTALITFAALWAAFDSAKSWKGAGSLAALVMVGAGAVVAGCATRYCFSRERTFGDFIEAVDGDEADTARHGRRQPAPAGSAPERR
jgi:hypothetical protein